MHIFRLLASLPAPLNAKRFSWQCFRYRPAFSIPPFPSRFAFASPSRLAPRFPSRPALPRPVPRLVSSRSSGVSPSPRSAPRFSPRLTFSRLPCRSIVPPLSSPRLPCRGAERGAEQVVAIRCVLYPWPVSVAFQSACQARPASRVAVQGGRRKGRTLPIPSACLCDFRVVGAICIYSFGKSPNI